MQGLETIVHFILCGFDVLMSYSFFHSMFIERVSKRKLLIFSLVTSLGIFGINSLGNPFANFLVVPIFYIFFSTLVFKISLYKSIIYTIIYFIIFACGREMAFEMLYRLLMSIYPQVIEKIFPPGGIMFLIVEYILSFAFMLYVEKYTKRLEIDENSTYDWYLLIMPVASIMILFSFVYLEFPQEQGMQILMCGGSFLLYFSNAVVFVLLADLTRTMNKAKLAELSLLKQDMDRAHFERIEEANNVYRKFMHDVHQYFNQIRHLASEGEDHLIVNIIDEVEGKLNGEEKRKIYIASPVLNSILAEAYRKAKEQKIDMEIFVEDGVNVDFIQDTDKISMFGNLLDNAVEAAAKCEEGMRKMKVRLFMGSQHILIFEIENTWLKAPVKQGERFLSTKKNAANHGLGIGIVRELAGKYGGELELTEREEWFVTTLMLSKYFK